MELHAASQACSAAYQHPAPRDLFRVWSQLESFSVGFKPWTDFSYLIPFLVLCSRASHPILVVGEYVKHLVDTQAAIINQTQLTSTGVPCPPARDEGGALSP